MVVLLVAPWFIKLKMESLEITLERIVGRCNITDGWVFSPRYHVLTTYAKGQKTMGGCSFLVQQVEDENA